MPMQAGVPDAAIATQDAAKRNAERVKELMAQAQAESPGVDLARRVGLANRYQIYQAHPETEAFWATPSRVPYHQERGASIVPGEEYAAYKRPPTERVKDTAFGDCIRFGSGIATQAFPPEVMMRKPRVLSELRKEQMAYRAANQKGKPLEELHEELLQELGRESAAVGNAIDEAFKPVSQEMRDLAEARIEQLQQQSERQQNARLESHSKRMRKILQEG